MVSRKSSSEPGYFRLRSGFPDPCFYPVSAGILDGSSVVISHQSSEFNQSVPHCFPQRSFSICSSLQLKSYLLLPHSCFQMPSQSKSVLWIHIYSVYSLAQSVFVLEAAWFPSSFPGLKKKRLPWSAPLLWMMDDGCSVRGDSCDGWFAFFKQTSSQL